MIPVLILYGSFPQLRVFSYMDAFPYGIQTHDPTSAVQDRKASVIFTLLSSEDLLQLLLFVMCYARVYSVLTACGDAELDFCKRSCNPDPGQRN
jgi:hypothetical protein